MLDSAEGKSGDEGDGDAHDAQEEQPAGGVGLHFVKLRPEPVTGENMRSLVQVNSSAECLQACVHVSDNSCTPTVAQISQGFATNQ